MKKIVSVFACFLLTLTVVNANGQNEQAGSAEGQKSLTYWVPLNPNVSQVVQDFGETEYAKELMRKTGINIEYQHISAGNNAQIMEGFNILIASGNYPDIIEYKFIDYPGGPQAALNDKVIIPLNDVFEKYSPNVSKIINDNPDISKMISTNDGTFYVYPFLRGLSSKDNKLLFSEGLVLRKDLLDKVGMDIPVTPDDWYKVLTAFRDQLGVKIPMTLRKDHVSRVLSPGYDSWGDFYIEDGQVHFGPIEPERKDYLEGTHRWYAEDLLDHDYFAVDKKTQATKVLNNLVGATYAPGGSGIGTWLPAMRKSDPAVNLISCAPMTPDAGRLSKFSKMNTIYSNSGYSAAISTACRDIETAAKLLDFNYSEEGHLLANFGIEGVSYNMVNGYPTYTDMIKNNPNGLSVTQAMSLYIRGHIHGPFVQDQRELEQYYSLPQLQEALELWTKTDMGEHLVPPLSISDEDSDELASIMNNVTTFMEEMESKFIIGALDISEFDSYVDQLKKFGIERAIEIKQNAYDTYMSK